MRRISYYYSESTFTNTIKYVSEQKQQTANMCVRGGNGDEEASQDDTTKKQPLKSGDQTIFCYVGT